MELDKRTIQSEDIGTLAGILLRMSNTAEKFALEVESLKGKTGNEALEIRKKILETDEKIDPLRKQAKDKRDDDLKKLRDKLDDAEKLRPGIAASTLAQAGGGGPAAVFGKDEIERKQADLLLQIKNLLAAGLPGGPDAPQEPTA